MHHIFGREVGEYRHVEHAVHARAHGLVVPGIDAALEQQKPAAIERSGVAADRAKVARFPNVVEHQQREIVAFKQRRQLVMGDRKHGQHALAVHGVGAFGKLGLAGAHALDAFFGAAFNQRLNLLARAFLLFAHYHKARYHLRLERFFKQIGSLGDEQALLVAAFALGQGAKQLEARFGDRFHGAKGLARTGHRVKRPHEDSRHSHLRLSRCGQNHPAASAPSSRA
ncbi:MAG: hypothetical protein HPKKFMNG_01995 [Planctomycetes bacterium]|nr:hypothetical protein [Planctomycetota bacterium]